MAVRLGTRRPERRRAAAVHDPGRKPRPSWLATLGVITSIVLTASLGLLNVLGISAGPVVGAITVLLLVGTFVASSRNLLAERFRGSSPLVRALIGGGLACCIAGLLAVGWATRPDLGLYRLPGTQDIAVAGFRAADPDDQQLLDDVASTVVSSLSKTADGEVHDYSAEADAPLHALRDPAAGGLDAWALDFVEQTDAEIVLAGDFERTGFEGSSAVVAVYVSPSIIGDAPELGGWFRIAHMTLDRSLDSASARSEFVARLQRSVGGLSLFLRGLDAWEAGHYGEALDELTKASRGEAAGTALAQLVTLFAGHAEESLALAEEPAASAARLTTAREHYESLVPSRVVGDRAALSIAGNDYYRSSREGCRPGTLGANRLGPALHTLAEYAGGREVSSLLRLKARANLVQVDACRRMAGLSADPAAAAAKRRLLSMTIDDSASDAPLRRQMKALVLATDAVRLAGESRYAGALRQVRTALSLDDRLDRQATWTGLQGLWRLELCQIGSGERDLRRSLTLRRELIRAGRLPSGAAADYEAAYEDASTAAEARCDRVSGPSEG